MSGTSSTRCRPGAEFEAAGKYQNLVACDIPKRMIGEADVRLDRSGGDTARLSLAPMALRSAPPPLTADMLDNTTLRKGYRSDGWTPTARVTPESCPTRATQLDNDAPVLVREPRQPGEDPTRARPHPSHRWPARA